MTANVLSIAVFCVAGYPSQSVQQCEGVESPAVYEITIAAVVPILPPPLRTFIETNAPEFRDLVLADVEAEVHGRVGERHWHYVELDMEAPVADMAARRAAVRRFPRDREQAKALFERHGSDAGGILPWIIEERYQNLEHGFRTGDLKQALRAAAELLHFSADAAMPPHTSACFFSRERGFVARSLYHRTFTTFCEVLSFEVRILPGRVSPSTRPLADAFATATQAYDALEQVVCGYLDCPPELVSQVFSADGHRSFDEWSGVLPPTLPYMRMQTERGAVLAANLIVGAWTQAGRPDLKPVTAPAAPPATTAAAAPVAPASAETNSDSFVGSQSSTVYHRATCAHAVRVRAENRVTFDSAAKAQAAGRTPCKSCKPDGE